MVEKSDKMNRDGWIAAALAAMAEGGVEKVRVEPLAKSLGVTKGSFYWHFADRGALLEALLERWIEMQTGSVIEDVEGRGGSAADILANVIGHIVKMDVGLEVGLRNWAATDARVRAIIEQVDARRIAHLASILERAGIPGPAAQQRARFLYCAFIGEVAFGRPIPPEERPTASKAVRDMLLRWP
ncbi:MAG: TetR/AcrR family transcriptional regulator [Notoacmeibacter sp.]|nr:TetR/AcrR family transcriptional regulator [Notoacmeibacter sp.]MCC0033490.1 TetR/AcrR family transcriptional regulator [Brucellaceae bacterium]